MESVRVLKGVSADFTGTEESQREEVRGDVRTQKPY